MQIILPILILLLSISFSSHAQDNACYQAGLEERDQEVLSLCVSAANYQDAHAAYLWALANLNINTKLSSEHTIESETELAMRPLKLSTIEKHAIQDSIAYLKTAVEQGHVEAHFLLGFIYLKTSISMLHFNGNFTETTEHALALLNTAAENDSKGAIMLLAEYAVQRDFQTGEPVGINTKYFDYLTQAAKEFPEYYAPILTEYRKFADAANKISSNPDEVDAALVAKEGNRLIRSQNRAEFDEGVRLLNSAAKRNDPLANYTLAKLHEKHDKELAIQYYLAAGENHKDAALWLGEHYGCKLEIEQAMKWFKVSKTLGHNEARYFIEELEEYGDLANCPTS